MTAEQIRERIEKLRKELRSLEERLIDITRPDCVSELRSYLERNPHVFVKHLVNLYPGEELQYSHNDVRNGSFVFCQADGRQRFVSIIMNEFEFDEQGFTVIDGRGVKIARFDYLINKQRKEPTEK